MRSLAQPLQVFLWSYVVVYAVFTSLIITQVDLWWQLAEGAHILHTWTLPTQPAVAYGIPAHHYFDEYAGYEVVIAGLYQLTGFVGLWIFFSAIYLAIIFLPGAVPAQKFPAINFVSTVALLAAVLLMHGRMIQRPELVGGLLQVVLMRMLLASTLDRMTPRTMGWLFLLFVVWSNVHDTLVFGFFTLGLWIANELWLRAKSAPMPTLVRRGAMLAVGVVVAAMIHPYGPRRLLFPFLQQADPGATAMSPEMWPVTYFSTAWAVFQVTLVLLAWGMATIRGVPLWLMVFSIFSVVMSFMNYRFVDLTAISLLFIYAARREKVAANPRPLPAFVRLGRDTILCVLCFSVMLMDAVLLLRTYNGQRAERRLATHGLRYASDIADYPVVSNGRRIPVLCSYGMGSYLSFEGNGNWRPMLDSGLSHFNDDTKRFFFFVWYDPAMLEDALPQLSVDYVLIDRDTFSWIPTLHHMTVWRFVACTPNGMIWQRVPGGPHPLDDAERAQVADSIAALERDGDVTGAFLYSTLLDRPADSLAILSGYRGESWWDPVFLSVWEWTTTISDVDARQFLAGDHCDDCPVLGALVSAKVGPQAYERFVAEHPKDPGWWQWKGIEASMLIKKGDTARAQAILDSISPPTSSAAYYSLHSGLPYEKRMYNDAKWQSLDSESDPVWNVPAALNKRIKNLQ